MNFPSFPFSKCDVSRTCWQVYPFAGTGLTVRIPGEFGTLIIPKQELEYHQPTLSTIIQPYINHHLSILQPYRTINIAIYRAIFFGGPKTHGAMVIASQRRLAPIVQQQGHPLGMVHQLVHHGTCPSRGFATEKKDGLPLFGTSPKNIWSLTYQRRLI